MGAIGGVRHKDATGTNVWSAQGFSDPEQSISYLTAHDNLDLRDKIEAAGVTDLADKKKLQVYANAMIFASQGISFIHGGEEIGRTKAAAGKDIHNSYNTTTGANDYKWNLKSGDWKDVSEAYAKLIALRKAHPAFRMTTADYIFDNVTLDTENSTDEIVVFDINGAAVGDEWSSIKVAFNSKETAVTVNNLDEQLVKVVDGYNVLEGVVNNDVAEPQSVTIWAVLPQD
jgi:pullulanase/glycogen debranching enzyme